MPDFEAVLKDAASEIDAKLPTDMIDEAGYFKSVLGSYKGQGSGMTILTWIGITVICVLLFFFIWKFFHAETTRDQILFASLVIMMNSAQIALKLWFNMQINRRAITREIKLLQIMLATSLAAK